MRRVWLYGAVIVLAFVGLLNKSGVTMTAKHVNVFKFYSQNLRYISNIKDKSTLANGGGKRRRI